ncbi:MAG: hypothetical protein OXL38_11655 [Gammaproteobacteria bacterium]|nr:hypothetical protein [Gammaproteobacteria bacterium]
MASASEPGARLDLESVNALFDRAILDDGGIDAVVGRLLAAANDPALPDWQRADAWLRVAHLRWRFGRLDGALEATDAALAIRERTDGILLKGRLLDAAGEEKQAAAWYERAADATDRATEREFIRLRLTMAEASARNIDALVELAQQRDADFRNRAAITLALLGHTEEAIALFRVSPATDDQFRQHARLAHWAIHAGRLEVAQSEAWHAYRHADARLDRLYAIALLLESYREAGALDDFLARLHQAMLDGEADPDLVQTRVVVLVETENYDAAIEFYEQADRSVVDVDARRRLIDLYEAAGRSDDLVAEYERLMAAEPHVVDWYAGLAAHYLNNAESDRALAVWRVLAERNPDREPVLMEAAGAMVQMGFAAEAVTMIEDYMAEFGDSRAALLFLFDVRLGEGRNDQALGILERFEALLADDPSGIRDLADAYERIGGPGRAIRILEALRERNSGLGYDERLRLAWLYTVADRKEDALAMWQALWVSVDSPARRLLAESQFLLIAAELNKLGDIVVDLEEKLVAREADRNEIGLLVRIYTEVGDGLSATEVIEEFALYGGTDEVDRLRQLARVHMMLADYAAYHEVLRALFDADPENRREHAQNIVLNMLAFDLAEESQGRFGEIQRWLGRLRELDAAGVSGEFEAGIYSRGGFDAEAIGSYRRALVTHPENADNLLLLADVMKTAGQRDDAVSVLQYVAEHAEDDSAFVVAIDGIINMIGARSFTEQLTTVMRKTFRWTQRIILERIAGHSDRFYLYQLFADVAHELGDREGEFVALETSLSEAGVRRPAVLRELVTLATPNTGFAGYSTGTGDAERQITHGRRLIALKQELPPEVYINLGSAVLDQGAVKDAERAFDLIRDITGMINVEKTKANLFHEAGHSDAALAAYTHALNVNPDDLSLLAPTAALREVNGQDAIANRLYFRALGNLLRAQPQQRRAQRPGSDDSQRALQAMFGIVEDTAVTRDYRSYFEPLAQGLLVTWPDDPAEVAERQAATRAMFDDELASIPTMAGAVEESPQSSPTISDLAQFTRLERIAWFARRVAARTSDRALREHVDAALHDRFVEDDRAARPPDESTTVLDRHFENALASGQFETAVRLARVAGDEERLAALLRQRIDEGRYRDGLAYAHALLGPVAFKRLIAVVAPSLKNDKAAFIELIEADPALVLRVEADLGRELIGTSELLDLLKSPEAKAHLDQPLIAGDGRWQYLKQKAINARRADANSVTLFEALASSPFSAEEFNSYLHAMPVDERRDWHRLYEILVGAYEASGTMASRTEELSGRLRDLGDHDFTVWMMVRHRDERPLTTHEHREFANRSAEIREPSSLQTLATARLHAKAGIIDDASQHYRLLAAQLIRLREFEGNRNIIVHERGTPLIDLSALIAEIANALSGESGRSVIASIIAAARYAGEHDAYSACADALILKSFAQLHPVENVLSEAMRLSETAGVAENPTGEGQHAKAVELARLHAMAGDAEKAFALLRMFVAADEGGVASVPRQDALRRLSQLYGLDHRDASAIPTTTALRELILRRERLFPATAENGWPGDVHWMTQTADALVTWLDDVDLDESGVLETVLVVVWQLNARGETEAGKAVLDKIAAWMLTDENPHNLRYLARVALELDTPIPLALATRILAEGTLTAAEEVKLLEALVRDNDPAAVLAAGRVADSAGDRLALMAFLEPLARAAGDGAYAVDLERRLGKAEEAREALVSD